MKKIEPGSAAPEEEPFILNLRPSAEHRKAHVRGSCLLPLRLLEPEKGRQAAGGEFIYLLCPYGNCAGLIADTSLPTPMTRASVPSAGPRKQIPLETRKDFS